MVATPVTSLLCAVVPPSQAEAKRRALDAEGLLDVSLKAFQITDGSIALPLRADSSKQGCAGNAWKAHVQASSKPCITGRVQAGEAAQPSGSLLKNTWTVGELCEQSILSPLHGGVSSHECGPVQVALLSAPATGRQRGQQDFLRDSLRRVLLEEGVPSTVAEQLLLEEALPRRWERLGDVALLAPRGMFESGSPAANALATLSTTQRAAMYAVLAKVLGCQRLGVQGRIEKSLHRKSSAAVIWPSESASGWTSVRDNGVTYSLDVTKNMYSSGNGTEKIQEAFVVPMAGLCNSQPPAAELLLDFEHSARLYPAAVYLARVAKFECDGQVVVDLYAGIGYFTLPYLVHARAAMVHACEWDADALVALRHNLLQNGVAARCIVHAGDNKESLPAFAMCAHRVNLGLIPSSEAGWPVAVAALRPEGGWLHVHANVSSDPALEAAWTARLEATFARLAAEAGRSFHFAVAHLERVKWYAPKIRHVVADVLAAPRQMGGGVIQ